MEVKRAAVHYISKVAHSDEAVVTPAGELLEISPQLNRLVEEILESYNARCAHQSGVFQADEVNYPLSALFRAYHQEVADFLPTSEVATNRLAILMRQQPLSTGGHVLFVHYIRTGASYLLIVKLNSAKGSMFEGLARVKDAVHLNVHTLQVAARINLSAWLAGEEIRYLSFVCKREQGHPSNYFKEFIGCDMMADSKVESSRLATVVQDYCNQQMVAGLLSEDDSVSVMRRVFDYAVERTKAREVVSLAAVAAVVSPENSEAFNVFLNAHPNKPTDEFIADRGSLRKLAAYVFVSKEFKLTMTHQFKTAHRVRVENDRLIIENPPTQLVEDLAN
ncbi:nucleoid-associated protein [Xanthomonas translucens pv. translucens]|uniref:nucleoid-associated protein n=1 Tax=Xanthomonas campestris pv. translucens TaxID=343 RepID=UPI001F1C26F8|nr:nucleoid-associated protein [Xanthomonas translucens]MCS3358833.1 nucleoid-associated protein [Xanthomonas translucens pv. translucens]MCS3373002.1 nucleoid-associated protein [Xanthomonas translucens pv. translucens]MCT8288206.1 nucleoid-associated protein [Xanthomonas translucens pv. translucens]MCT8291959.1 nucleoid-associated protein [Xanthomonas translucens pv. translucens]MCT8311907.1 nucleoid-associated protein [Xanthomonas translucens pv. translucens]